jgi:hypothetical protein
MAHIPARHVAAPSRGHVGHLLSTRPWNRWMLSATSALCAITRMPRLNAPRSSA